MDREYLEFIREIERLKTIERLNRTSNLQRAESDAEHIWHLVMMVYLFSENRPEINKWKAVEMAMVHDLVEVYAGDVQFWDENKKSPEEKKKIENQAAKKLFKLLPRKMESRFMTLWEEYEERQSKESKFVYTLDKLQPLLQRVVSKDGVWKEKKVDKKRLMEIKPELMIQDIEMSDIWDSLVDEAVEKKLLWNS